MVPGQGRAWVGGQRGRLDQVIVRGRWSRRRRYARYAGCGRARACLGPWTSCAPSHRARSIISLRMACQRHLDTRSRSRKLARMTIRALITPVVLALSVLPANAAGKIAYGSRAGMEVTVTSVSGIGTANSVIKAAHTRQNARSYCTDYVQNNSKKCIDDVLRETRLSDQITGNCKTGTFTTFNGGKYRFAGPAKASDDVSGSYRIFEDGKILDGSSASGYPVAIETFRALCPGQASKEF